MSGSNENVPLSVDGDASTLCAYATESPPENDIFDEDMDDLPSIAGITAARIVVTPLLVAARGGRYTPYPLLSAGNQKSTPLVRLWNNID
jgi:hypothetical protein